LKLNSSGTFMIIPKLVEIKPLRHLYAFMLFLDHYTITTKAN
jgi:hypothetical protein